MTPFLASASCTILVFTWDKHHQTSFPSKTVLCICNINEISAVVHFNLTLETNIQHWTNSLPIVALWETPATCSDSQADSSWVERPSWWSLSLFRLEANYIFLRTSHFFWLSSSSPFPQQPVMATQIPQTGEGRSESSEMMGASSNASLERTLQQRRQRLVHYEAVYVATKNMTQHANLQIIRKTRSNMNQKQHAIGCEYVHIMVDRCQLIT